MRDLPAQEFGKVRAVEVIELFITGKVVDICLCMGIWWNGYASMRRRHRLTRPTIRNRILNELEFLCMAIKDNQNTSNESVISAMDDLVTDCVIRADEN